MTTLHIDEYNAKSESYSRKSGVSPNTVYPSRVTTQAKITTTGTSQKSAVVNEATAFVSIRVVGGPVYIEVGTNPTASNASKYLADGDIYDVDVEPGNQVAVISA